MWNDMYVWVFKYRQDMLSLILIVTTCRRDRVQFVIHDLWSHLLLGYSARPPRPRQRSHWRVCDEGSRAPSAWLPSACKVLKLGQKNKKKCAFVTLFDRSGPGIVDIFGSLYELCRSAMEFGEESSPALAFEKDAFELTVEDVYDISYVIGRDLLKIRSKGEEVSDLQFKIVRVLEMFESLVTKYNLSVEELKMERDNLKSELDRIVAERSSGQDTASFSLRGWFSFSD